MADVKLKLIRGHDGDEVFASGKHEWVSSGGKVKADSRGRPNPRMATADWQRWVCANPSCDGLLLVADSFVNDVVAREIADVDSADVTVPMPEPES